MNYLTLHSWEVSPQEAVRIQKELKKRIVLKSNFLKFEKIAATDVSFCGEKAISAVVVFKYPELKLMEEKKGEGKISFPYIPGLLAFREGAVILKAFKKLKIKPDLILFDGQGISHPRKMGIATHLGIILDTPSIGCAKSHLYGVYKMPPPEKGSFSYIFDREGKEVLGVALRTRSYTKPLFVSCGYKISLKEVIKLVLELCPRFRIPEPLRYAHHLAGKSLC